MFSEQERRIYGPYPTGRAVSREDGFAEPQLLFADPIAAYRELNAALGGQPQKVIEESNHGDPEAKCRANQLLQEAACRVFHLEPFNMETGRGMLQEECKGRITDFLLWLKKNEPASPTPPTTPANSASAPSRPFWDQSAPATRSGSASGLIADDCGCSDATT